MTDKIKNRPEDQKLPVASDSPPMHDVAAFLLDARKALGIKRYGQPLQAHNGRNAVQDVLEEALDCAAYSAQAMWEQDHPEKTFVGALIRALIEVQHLGPPAVVDFGSVFVPDAVLAYLDAMHITYVRTEEKKT